MRKTLALATHGNSNRITLPPPMLRYLGWRPQEELMATITEGGRLEIVSVDQYLKDTHERMKREESARQQSAQL